VAGPIPLTVLYLSTFSLLDWVDQVMAAFCLFPVLVISFQLAFSYFHLGLRRLLGIYLTLIDASHLVRFASLHLLSHLTSFALPPFIFFLRYLSIIECCFCLFLSSSNLCFCCCSFFVFV
jgi:hypothetical protein